MGFHKCTEEPRDTKLNQTTDLCGHHIIFFCTITVMGWELKYIGSKNRAVDVDEDSGKEYEEFKVKSTCEITGKQATYLRDSSERTLLKT